MVTVHLDQRAAAQLRRLVVPGGQELPERVALPAEPARIQVVGEQVDQLVAEDGQAARLQPDHRRPGRDRFAQVVDDPPQPPPGGRQHPVVVQRAAAAQPLFRQPHGVPGVLQDADRGDADLGVK